MTPKPAPLRAAGTYYRHKYDRSHSIAHRDAQIAAAAVGKDGAPYSAGHFEQLTAHLSLWSAAGKPADFPLRPTHRTADGKVIVFNSLQHAWDYATAALAVLDAHNTAGNLTHEEWVKIRDRHNFAGGDAETEQAIRDFDYEARYAHHLEHGAPALTDLGLCKKLALTDVESAAVDRQRELSGHTVAGAQVPADDAQVILAQAQVTRSLAFARASIEGAQDIAACDRALAKGLAAIRAVVVSPEAGDS